MNRITVGLLLAILVPAGACSRSHEPAPATEVVAIRAANVPSAPDDPAWRDAPPFSAALVVRAITDGEHIAFRLDWADPTRDDVPGPGRFSDAVAVQLPQRTTADVPAPQMGEGDRPVEIAYWRATWQAVVDGREDSIKAIYPGATVDHYPFDAASLAPGSEAQREMAERYAPARALGNQMAGPRNQPVQDLVAEGPGTLRPAADGHSTGRGVRTGTGWSVVLVRPAPAHVQPGSRTQVAFAVWEGSHQEAGARKMRSVWIPLRVSGP
jgi:hypothetical protein